MKDKKVLVAGCGGLGCYEVEMLARLGVGHIIAADGDRFSESNMNRQLYCTADSLGRYKAEAAAERWPDCVEAVCCFIDESNADALVRGCDVVVDALDSSSVRKLLASACERAGVPMVHGAIGDLTSQCCVIFPGDGDILDILYPSENNRRIATVSYTPSFCASMQAALASKLLKGEEVERRTLYISDLDSMIFEKIRL